MDRRSARPKARRCSASSNAFCVGVIQAPLPGIDLVGSARTFPGTSGSATTRSNSVSGRAVRVAMQVRIRIGRLRVLLIRFLTPAHRGSASCRHPAGAAAGPYPAQSRITAYAKFSQIDTSRPALFRRVTRLAARPPDRRRSGCRSSSRSGARPGGRFALPCRSPTTAGSPAPSRAQPAPQHPAPRR